MFVQYSFEIAIIAIDLYMLVINSRNENEEPPISPEIPRASVGYKPLPEIENLDS